MREKYWLQQRTVLPGKIKLKDMRDATRSDKLKPESKTLYECDKDDLPPGRNSNDRNDINIFL